MSGVRSPSGFGFRTSDGMRCDGAARSAPGAARRPGTNVPRKDGASIGLLPSPHAGACQRIKLKFPVALGCPICQTELSIGNPPIGLAREGHVPGAAGQVAVGLLQRVHRLRVPRPEKVGGIAWDPVTEGWRRRGVPKHVARSHEGRRGRRKRGAARPAGHKGECEAAATGDSRTWGHGGVRTNGQDHGGRSAPRAAPQSSIVKP
jgi:hypothetical protein